MAPPPDPVQSQTAADSNGADETLSPLEQEVLDEYARLLGNLNEVRFCFRARWTFPSSCSSAPSFNPFWHSLLGRMLERERADRVSIANAALSASGHDGAEPVAADSGLAARIGAQDVVGVYVVEGECV
jgi:hypothetical protein